MRRRSQPVVLLLILLSGCAVVPAQVCSPHIAEPGWLGDCARLFAELDAAVSAAGVRDGGSFPVAGFPYLRVDRFLASFRKEALEPAALEAWGERMMALDQSARRVELANLPPAAGERFGDGAAIASCARRMLVHDLARPERVASLRHAAVAPDEYREWQRVVGLYPLTRWFVLAGVEDWQAKARERFRYAAIGYPRQTWYVPALPPADAAKTQRVVREAPQDALGIPLFSAEELERLFAAHAPVWQVAQAGEFDRPGRPVPTAGAPGFDRSQALVYRRLGFTRFEGEVLPQLSYLIWFSERPRQSFFDILGGRLDSVILRVTLGRDGRPLLYDSIHGCGCWHLSFPTDALAPRARPDYAEPPLVFSAAPVPAAGERLVVSLASATHEIDAISSAGAPRGEAVGYALRPYEELLSLPTPTGNRSLFVSSGLAPGTERRERYILWPMAVPEPGATRQWGRHATAFVGERHFDDPDLIEQIFKRMD